MIEFLDDLELNQVSELSGVKPVTIKQSDSEGPTRCTAD